VKLIPPVLERGLEHRSLCGGAVQIAEGMAKARVGDEVVAVRYRTDFGRREALRQLGQFPLVSKVGLIFGEDLPDHAVDALRVRTNPDEEFLIGPGEEFGSRAGSGGIAFGDLLGLQVNKRLARPSADERVMFFVVDGDQFDASDGLGQAECKRLLRADVLEDDSMFVFRDVKKGAESDVTGETGVGVEG
jgi:hypothetical protein